MATNANPNLSTVAEESEEAAPSLPVVRVLPTQDGNSMEVKFDEYDATTAPLVLKMEALDSFFNNTRLPLKPWIGVPSDEVSSPAAEEQPTAPSNFGTQTVEPC